ncbi:MAG: hypothetical protein GY943_16455 [Chloroflexi bacterium]|nr:hypothetical protein [Chloroflexota bacterium]
MAFLQKRWLWATAVSLLIFTIVGGGLIGTGVFDPKPIGTLQQSITPGKVQIDAGATVVQWLDLSVDVGAGSVRGTAVYQSGEKDIVYGVVIGKSMHYVQVVVSQVGYVAVEEVMNNQQSTINNQQLTNPQSALLSPHSLLPYQLWTHVQMGGVPNEIWVDWEDGQLTVRINRELLWVGEVEIDPVEIGIVGGSFGETAVIDFQLIELFQATK